LREKVIGSNPISQTKSKQMPRINKGKVQFGSMPDKYAYILKTASSAIDYIGKETKLSPTEKALRKLAMKDIEKAIKYLNKISK
jgi:hypothetical protein